MNDSAAVTKRTRTVVGEFRLTPRRAVEFSVVGTAGFVVALVALVALYSLAAGSDPALVPELFGSDGWGIAVNILVVLVLTTGILVPHELLHGLAMRAFGGHPRYGVGVAHSILPYGYATTDEPFERNEFLVVLLAPLVGITLVGVTLMVAFEWGWLILPLAANVGGAVVDCWMASSLLRYPDHVVCVDSEEGTTIYGNAGDEPATTDLGAIGWDLLVGTGIAAVPLLFLGIVVTPIALSALGVSDLAIGTPGTPTFVYEFVETPDEIRSEVGSGLFGVAGLVGLGYALFRQVGRRPRGGATTQN